MTRPGHAPTDLTKQHRPRVHAVRVDHLTVLDRTLYGGLLGLDYVERSRVAALPTDVEDHERLVAAHNLVGQVKPARADVHHGHVGR